MQLALAILAWLVALGTVAGVIGLFVWAARKDGEHDRDVQRKLGTKRRTRIGR